MRSLSVCPAPSEPPSARPHPAAWAVRSPPQKRQPLPGCHSLSLSPRPFTLLPHQERWRSSPTVVWGGAGKDGSLLRTYCHPGTATRHFIRTEQVHKFGYSWGVRPISTEPWMPAEHVLQMPPPSVGTGLSFQQGLELPKHTLSSDCERQRPGLSGSVMWAQSQRAGSLSPSLPPFGDLPSTFASVAAQGQRPESRAFACMVPVGGKRERLSPLLQNVISAVF